MTNVAPSGIPKGDRTAMIKKKEADSRIYPYFIFPVLPIGGSIPKLPVCS